jgi:hypothetical protein
VSSSDTNRPLGAYRAQADGGRSETQLRLARRDDAKRVAFGYPRTEPFTTAEADAYLAEFPLTCLLCGQKFKLLSQHLRQRHGMTAREYKQQYHLPLSRPLCTPDFSASTRATQLRKVAAGRGWTQEQRDAGRAKAHAAPREKCVYRNAKVLLHLDKLIAGGRLANGRYQKAPEAA